MYELMSSERSYLSSLEVLIQHFHGTSRGQSCTPGKFSAVMEQWQHQAIFSNIIEVGGTSSAFLAMLQEKQEVGVVITPISDVVLNCVSCIWW